MLPQNKTEKRVNRMTVKKKEKAVSASAAGVLTLYLTTWVQIQ
jgi:hypothetical protein